jgi:hypothetical protein
MFAANCCLDNIHMVIGGYGAVDPRVVLAAWLPVERWGGMEVGVHGAHTERKELKSLGRLLFKFVEPMDGDGFGAVKELVNNLLKNQSGHRTGLGINTQSAKEFDFLWSLTVVKCHNSLFDESRGDTHGEKAAVCIVVGLVRFDKEERVYSSLDRTR